MLLGSLVSLGFSSERRMHNLGVGRPLARFLGGNSGQDATVPVRLHNTEPGKYHGFPSFLAGAQY